MASTASTTRDGRPCRSTRTDNGSYLQVRRGCNRTGDSQRVHSMCTAACHLDVFSAPIWCRSSCTSANPHAVLPERSSESLASLFSRLKFDGRHSGEQRNNSASLNSKLHVKERATPVYMCSLRPDLHHRATFAAQLLLSLKKGLLHRMTGFRLQRSLNCTFPCLHHLVFGLTNGERCVQVI